MHTAKEFWMFFSKIPDEQWCCGYYTDENGRYCVLGHLGERQDVETTESHRLEELISESAFEETCISINDGLYISYPVLASTTPRGRILEALAMIIGGVA